MSVLAAEARARTTQGISSQPIWELAARVIRARHPGGGLLLDVGCGTGAMGEQVGDCFDRYVGVDLVPYDGFPAAAEFHQIDLNRERVTLPGDCARVVTALGTIECLENPRAFVRELTRLTKPGGWIILTTSNQLSLLSTLSVLLRNQFSAFRDGTHCPARITALLEVDLVRIARECGLVDVAIQYTDQGRLPFTPWH